MKINEIDWRPISECPKYGSIPKGMILVFYNKTYSHAVTRGGYGECAIDNSDCFALIRKPVVERKLKPCPFPACGRADMLHVKQDDRNDCFVECENCHCRGPSCIIPSRAKEAWGYE